MTGSIDHQARQRRPLFVQLVLVCTESISRQVTQGSR